MPRCHDVTRCLTTSQAIHVAGTRFDASVRCWAGHARPRCNDDSKRCRSRYPLPRLVCIAVRRLHSYRQYVCALQVQRKLPERDSTWLQCKVRKRGVSCTKQCPRQAAHDFSADLIVFRLTQHADRAASTRVRAAVSWMMRNGASHSGMSQGYAAASFQLQTQRTTPQRSHSTTMTGLTAN